MLAEKALLSFPGLGLTSAAVDFGHRYGGGVWVPGLRLWHCFLCSATHSCGDSRRGGDETNEIQHSPARVINVGAFQVRSGFGGNL